MEIGNHDVWEISEELLSHPKTGDLLERIPDVFVSFRSAWFRFYPDSLVYDAPLHINSGAKRPTTWGAVKR
jgi:hypothetical protein